MMLGSVSQQPGERLAYSISYRDTLPATDALDNAIAFANKIELTVEGTAIDGPRVRFWVSGGLHRERYTVTVRTTTTEGRVFEDEIIFAIREIS